MAFSGLSYLAVVLAAVAGFITGSVWYGVLGKAWMSALGKTKEDMKPTPLPFIVAGIAQLVMAFMLAGILGHLGEVTVWNGIVSAFFIWLGFILPSMAVNHAFQGAKTGLTVIDSGHWLAVLVVMGAVLGIFGV